MTVAAALAGRASFVSEAGHLSNVVDRVVTALNDVADVWPVWRRGFLHPGGPHRRLAGCFGPISIGEDECGVFARLIESLQPAHGFIIGNAFGFSSCAIAEAMRRHGGRSVVTLDSEQEGDGQRCAAVARALTERMGLSLLKNKNGVSPADIGQAVEVDAYDLVFIDGEHRHPQVTRDFDGIRPFTSDQTVFVWHDYWLPGIPQGVQTATEQGIRCLWLPTSCEMVLGTRDPEVFDSLLRLFPAGVENPRPHSPLVAPSRMTLEFLRFQCERVVRLGQHRRPLPV